MPEITAAAARKLASIRGDFLAMTPDQRAAAVAELREKRSKAAVILKVTSRKKKDDNGKTKEITLKLGRAANRIGTGTSQGTPAEAKAGMAEGEATEGEDDGGTALD